MNAIVVLFLFQFQITIKFVQIFMHFSIKWSIWFSGLVEVEFANSCTVQSNAYHAQLICSPNKANTFAQIIN